MVPDGWLKTGNILPAVTAGSLEQLIGIVAQHMAQQSAGSRRLDGDYIADAFRRATANGGFSLGSGVAIPHTEHPELEETLVCLIVTQEPVPLPAIDGRPPDVFLFILSKPDPHAHLVLLAHWARLAQSKTFLEGLRRARVPTEIEELVRAAELRHAVSRTTAASRPTHNLVMISVSGEAVVDALLIGLVDDGYEDACVLEAQSLREAATREVPLFAAFRDIFGDPGGHRILILETPADSTNALMASVQRICEEHRAKDARAWVLPMHARWAAQAALPEAEFKGHG